MNENEEIIDDQEESLFEHHRIVVDRGQALLRIDKFLMARLPNATRTKIQDAIHHQFVKVNDKNIKPNHKIHPGDVVTVMLPEPPRDTDVVPENIPLHIVYEDDHLLVIPLAHRPQVAARRRRHRDRGRPGRQTGWRWYAAGPENYRQSGRDAVATRGH